MNEPAPPRQLRWSSSLRGTFIAVLIGAYGLLVSLGSQTYVPSLLIAAGLQVAILLARRFAPAYLLPQVNDVIELLADAATVLLFALGIFGAITSYGNLEM
jgi:hypothetical protein